MKKTNIGNVKTANKIPPKLPITHNFIASNPLPSNNNLCPGKTPNTVDSSGAPSKIEGIKLIKELITPEETKMIAVGKGPNIKDILRIIGIVLFGCNPGNNPATTPNIIPIIKEKSINNIIKRKLY